MSKLRFTNVDTARKHRIGHWIDTETLDVTYGIEANVKRGLWAIVVKDGSPLLFRTKQEARDWIRQASATGGVNA